MTDKRVDERASGYLELSNARKDSDCAVVEVSGGISRDRGCCNLWEAATPDADNFSCGTCSYIKQRRISQREANNMSPDELLASDRPGKGDK